METTRVAFFTGDSVKRRIGNGQNVSGIIPELTEKVSKTYMSRFWDVKEIPHHLEFCRKIGDVILLDGKYQLVSGYGIYSNQMWTERYYEDGIRLGASDYAMVEKSELITNIEIIEKVINSYVEGVTNLFNKFDSKFYSKNILLIHLSQFKEIKFGWENLNKLAS